MTVYRHLLASGLVSKWSVDTSFGLVSKFLENEAQLHGKKDIRITSKMTKRSKKSHIQLICRYTQKMLSETMDRFPRGKP